MAEVIATRAIDTALRRARGEDVSIPASGGGREDCGHAPRERNRYPVELEPGRACSPLSGTVSA